MKNRRLSKSRFVSGLQCHKLLWWKTHEPDAPELEPDESQQVIFDRGTMIGEVARTYVPGGVLIDFPYFEVNKKLKATAKAIEQGVKVIYEASFIANGVFVAVDILEKTRGGWNLIEVKSSTKAKPEHLPDVAIQTHVLEKAGINIRHIELMHLNRECRHPDLSSLFSRSNLTKETKGLLPSVRRELVKQKRILKGPLPDVEVGPFCTDPYDCPFYWRCWPEPPEHHISTLYRIGQKAVELESQGVETIFDLPSNYSLSSVADRQRRSVKTGKMIVEHDLTTVLKKLKRPIAFLDFETIQPAIPVWKGCRPYDHIPVQFSCHVLGKRSGLKRYKWLADGPGDPRRELAEKLLAACEGTETIVAYNASFEKRMIRETADVLSGVKRRLKALNDKIVDLLPIVRNHVYHPDFCGSFSLKSVLPALVPELSYDDLEISEGQTASQQLECLILHGDDLDAKDKNNLRKNLLRYCEMDTLAMVKLLERLSELCGK